MTTTLAEYLTTLGDPAAARLLGFKKSRIKAWRLGLRQPRPDDARKLIERSHGKLGWEGIYPPREVAPVAAPAAAEAPGESLA